MDVHAILRTHPEAAGKVEEPLIRCIEECYVCAQACIACADACLAEESVRKLTQCIRLDSDCADVCAATGAVASRLTGSNDEVVRAMLEVCGTACRRCAEECEKHARHHEHCRVCAAACRRCQHACIAALA